MWLFIKWIWYIKISSNKKEIFLKTFYLFVMIIKIFQIFKIATHLHILDQVYALLSLSISSQIDGVPYWYYEYLIRKSPNTMVSISSWCIFSFCKSCVVYLIITLHLWMIVAQSEESGIYRHYLASTAERDGILSQTVATIYLCYYAFWWEP
jgi:hypothetical protein